jgi:PPK2 family polyphosphate:nucleotide phosphotransferase
MNPRKQFRASAGIRLKDHAPDIKPLSSGDKTADKAKVIELAEQIAACQDVFYSEHHRKLLVILQGMDTSGKDGTVRGVFGKLDPLGVRSIAFRAPTLDEREHDYLWRVHREVPAQGQLVIFNRSHYEDVLVPMVHGAIDKDECARRYRHIREFERMLTDTGTVLVKFFLNISKDEQKLRLEERLARPEKHWKVDLNDLKERLHWDTYQQLYEKAISETDADSAPWYIIPSDSKTHRNLAVASIMLDVLKDMKLSYPPANPDYLKLKVV